MKFCGTLAALAFSLTIAGGVHGQSPREQLQQMVEQLQKMPNDYALRERIIKLALTVKPPPALATEAERRMVRGAAAFTGAASAADYQAAAREFEQATLAAPWYGDAYYNLGVAQDKAEDYEAALRSLKLAALASPDSKAAEKLSYAVEFRKEKAAAAKAAADTPQAREAALLQKVEGGRFVSRTDGKDHRGEIRSEEVYQVRNGTLVFTYRLLFNSMNLGYCTYGKCQPGDYVLARGAYRNGAFQLDFGDFTRLFRIRPDGQALVSDGGFYNRKPSDQTHSNRGEVVPRE